MDFVFPDVLGAIIGGQARARVGMESLQFAVGISPAMTYVGQPIEVILVLQNMVDQPIEVKVALQLPVKTAEGAPISLNTPRRMVALVMKGGEVGVMRLPIVPQPPTYPTQGVPVRVAVRQRVQGETPAQYVRAPLGGAPPSELAVSPFQLQVLRDVDYTEQAWDQSPESVTVKFDIVAAGGFNRSGDLKPRYTALWLDENMNAERTRADAHAGEARLIAADLMSNALALYPSFTRAIDELYSSRGLPLRPAESKTIAKLLTAALMDRSSVDRMFTIEGLRWYQTLCQVLAFDESAARKAAPELVMRHLFYAVVYDAAQLGFTLVRSQLRTDMGDRAERAAAINRLLSWMVGGLPAELPYLYLPMLLGGMTLHHQITTKGEDLWVLFEDLRESHRVRFRMADAASMPLFEMMERLLASVENELRDHNAGQEA